MTAFDDEQPLKLTREVAHKVGQDLSALSVDELRGRVEALQAEVARLNREIEAKSAHRGAADLLFKR
ncbi:DUF1192 domain-containing protein [Hansschlegelia quercus]|uniref:DUF1192 domain-containing protein n=1 Tax=Hansschlegelia quercus TaxID=2528245 RepID=A0A4Q9GF15_9HYPH|nr:DUF1192 domain-containing protein [Hansschlegelia quercus]TBN48632.1 DUF1192 domain-containing protein [Hansschlegelia quercus]